MLAKILGIVFMLALCIFIHELGHLVMGWLVGVKARIFSIGYGRGIWKKKIGETTFQVTGIPLGGYVLFKGDDGLALKGEKGEFLSTPPLKRMIPVIGGPLFNLILGYIIIFSLYTFGYRPTGTRIYLEPAYNEFSPGYQAGLRSGDKIVEVNGAKTETKYELLSEIGLAKGQDIHIKVDRDGKELDFVFSDPQIGIDFAGERRVEVTFGIKQQLTHWFQSKISSLDKGGEASHYMQERAEKTVASDRFSPRELALMEAETRKKAQESRAMDFLNDGDKILSVNGIEVHSVPELQSTLGKFQNEKVKLVVDRKKYPLLNPWTREKAEAEMTVLPAFVVELKNLRDKKYPEIPISTVSLQSHDAEIKLKLMSMKIDGKSFASTEELQKEVESKLGKRVQLQVGDQTWEATLGIRKIGLLGFIASRSVQEEQLDRNLSFGEIFIQSNKDIGKIISDNIRGLGMLFSGRSPVKDSVAGPVGLAKASGQFLEEGLYSYFQFIAFISIALMIMNLLPIPVADGGHIVFFTYEAIAGRPLPLAVQEQILKIGFFFLLFLGLYVTYHDVLR
ncbi:PDZ domain-containing protein [Leptospira wolffii]|uniref:Zinc protease n=1 Tax=Leptospira wolffii TaxID=409998 RepID=A0A2M9ZB76_9LEPT|nr:site-2 protease family protein [Leptospira wolffii]PJZ65668.1 zinc protease [Leptospira wolffii]TGK56119.1 PDZ domain-containing protein [Leptospira wolffii]TGK72165.1 PDZ domain-containing protein [Leptospira wolffii]TGK77469.1 PDZ domain-containing protein [Leptospira wolffii]TGL27742.1 PDZ domain-containing protein [Leptospira wolffii]